MVKIKGYTQISYTELQGLLFDAKKMLEMTYFEIAKAIQASSTQTAVNAFATTPKLSDVMLTKVMSCLGIDGFVLTTQGDKYYYIKQL